MNMKFSNILIILYIVLTILSSLLSSTLKNTQFGESYIEELSPKNNVPQNNFLGKYTNLENCGYSVHFLKANWCSASGKLAFNTLPFTELDCIK